MMEVCAVCAVVAFRLHASVMRYGYNIEMPVMHRGAR